jgi:hypothetical protein
MYETLNAETERKRVVYGSQLPAERVEAARARSADVSKLYPFGYTHCPIPDTPAKDVWALLREIDRLQTLARRAAEAMREACARRCRELAAALPDSTLPGEYVEAAYANAANELDTIDVDEVLRGLG